MCIQVQHFPAIFVQSQPLKQFPLQCNRGFGYLDAARAHMRDKKHVVLDVEACAEEVEECVAPATKQIARFVWVSNAENV